MRVEEPGKGTTPPPVATPGELDDDVVVEEEEDGKYFSHVGSTLESASGKSTDLEQLFESDEGHEMGSYDVLSKHIQISLTESPVHLTTPCTPKASDKAF